MKLVHKFLILRHFAKRKSFYSPWSFISDCCFVEIMKFKRTKYVLTENSLIPFQHRAVQHYEQAADYFKGEESTSSANKCLLKVAQYAAQLEDYNKAISIYEGVAGSCLDSSLLKYSAKEYFFRAALCHLCVDILNCQHAIEKYAGQYPAFQDSREFKFLQVGWRLKFVLKTLFNWIFSSFQSLIEHLEEQDIEKFTETVKDFDSISRLDQWYTTILLRIKKQYNDNPDLR